MSCFFGGSFEKIGATRRLESNKGCNFLASEGVGYEEGAAWYRHYKEYCSTCPRRWSEVCCWPPLEKYCADSANRKATSVIQNYVLDLAQRVSDDGLGEFLDLTMTVLSQLTKRSCSAGEDVSVAWRSERHLQSHQSSKKMSANDWTVAFKWRTIRPVVQITKLILVDLWHSWVSTMNTLRDLQLADRTHSWLR